MKTNLKAQFKAVIKRSGQTLALLAFLAACMLVMAHKTHAAGEFDSYTMNVQASFVVAFLALVFIASDARDARKEDDEKMLGKDSGDVL